MIKNVGGKNIWNNFGINLKKKKKKKKNSL